MTRGLQATIIAIGSAIALGVAGNLAYSWLKDVWRSVKKLKHLKPDENENIERAVARSSAEATLFCVERALGFENPKPIRTRLKAIRSGCRARLRRLSRDFYPIGIDHKRIIKIEGNEEYGALICQREIDSIESSYGELTDEIRVQFRKEWFELLVRQYLFQIKYDDPVEHVVQLKKLDEVEGKINEVLGQVDGLRSSPAAYSLPALGLLIGRNEEVKLGTERWRRDRLSPLLILGPPGIGKSKLGLALLYDDATRNRFGERRYHIRCDAFRSAKEVVAEIGSIWFGLRPGPTFAGQLIAELKRGECAVFLDNFETPWRTDTYGCEQWLQQLLGVDGVWLSVGMQGNEFPGGIDWAEPLRPCQLNFDDARHLFCAVSRNPGHYSDPRLETLLGDMNGIPHAIELLAAQAQGEKDLEILAERWLQEKTKLLQRGSDHSKQTDIEVSYDFAISNPSLDGEPRHLLRILACPPAGLPESALEAVSQCGSQHRAVARLVGSALVYAEKNQLRMLAPLRMYVSGEPKYRASVDEIAPVWKHFLALSAQWKEIKPPSPGIDTQSREETDRLQKHGLITLEEQLGFGYANLRWAVEVAAAQDADGVIDGAIGLNRLSRTHLPVGEPDLLLLARDVARKNHFPGQERCVAELGSELCNAAKAGQEDVMRRLLEAGVSADVSDPLGYTALHHAASTGRRSTVSLLLEKRASVDSLDRYHRTPLLVACTYGRTEVVERLLEGGADPTIEEPLGLTPLDLTVVSNRRAVLEAFITSGVSTNQLNSRGMSLLSLAASVGDIAMVELLLAKGADPNFPAQPGPKPLMIAALRGKKDIVETLCRAGSLVDALDTRGMSALMCACWLGRTGIVEVLIQHHADVNLETPSGWSALMFSAAFESQQGDEALPLVQWLVAAGANRAPKNATGSIAARLATLCGRADHESAQWPAENRAAQGGTI
jgi:ankyrin repeat protein